MKLKILSQYRNRILYIALSLVILLLVLSNLVYIIITPFFLYYIYKVHRELMKIIVIILLLFIVFKYIDDRNTIHSASQYEVKVTKVLQKEDYTNFTGKIGNKLVNVYLSDKEVIRPGDVYTIKGVLRQPIDQTVPGNFSYKNYLLSKRIKYQLFADEYEYKRSTFSLDGISYEIDRYIDKNMPRSKAYIKTFILADKSEFDQEVLNNVNKLGISHLFAVSGLHVGLLVIIITKLLSGIGVNENKTELTISFLLLIYILITSFSPSVVRAGMMYILLVINKKYDLRFSNLDLLSIIFIVSLLANPYFHYNPGFVLSFVVTFFLLVNSNILKKYQGVKLLFMVGFLSFLSTIPIIVNMNYEINLFTLFFNILFILYMTYIVLPLSYLCFVLPILDYPLSVVIRMYNTLIEAMTHIDIGIYNGAFTSVLEIMIYYIIVIYYLSHFDTYYIRKRVAFVFLIFILVSTNSQIYSFKKSVVFLDVHGDASIVSDSFNKCHILIDTGDSDEYDAVINYLKSKNIKRIDYFMISHFHSDHYGEMNDIIDEFDIVNIITPENSETYSGSQVTCGTLSFYIYELSSLNPNENNNSLIMSLFIEDKHYLFTGDAEKKREEEFIEHYSVDVDYLKIPHHGSTTSSSSKFIESIRPEEAFVMAHRFNKFDHPNYFIMDYYESKNIKVYRTDELGTIEVEYYFGRERKKYNMP